MGIRCPFNVGDTVRFVPSQRTKGLYQDIESFGVKINGQYVIRQIKDDCYLYFDDGVGGWPWNEFELVEPE